MKKINTLYFSLILLWIALFKIYLIPKMLQQSIKIGLIFVITMFIFKNVKSKKILFNSKIIIWCLAIIIASIFGFIKGHIELDNVFNSILHAVCIYYIYVLTKYAHKYNKIDYVIKSLFFVLSVYNILSLLTIFKLGSNSDSAIIYFLGDKFRTSYYLIMWCALFLSLFNKKLKRNPFLKLFYIIMIVGVLFLCNYIKCSTTVVGTLVMLILYIFPLYFRNLICKKNTLFIILIIATFAMFLFNFVLNIGVVRYFIINILNENINLTGRMHIYSFLIDVFKQNMFFGYGYGNYAVGIAAGFGNAQNAMFQLVIDYGLFGMTAFLFFFNDAVKKSKVDNFNWGMYIYLIIALICSSVEITFNYLFYISLIFIYVYNDKELKEGIL